MTPRLAAIAIAVVAIAATMGMIGKRAYDAGYWSAYYEFRDKVDAANRRHDQAVAAARVAIESRDASLIELTEQVKRAETVRDGAIEDARTKIPLSDACTACRVPAARIHGSVRP